MMMTNRMLCCHTRRPGTKSSPQTIAAAVNLYAHSFPAMVLPLRSGKRREARNAVLCGVLQNVGDVSPTRWEGSRRDTEQSARGPVRRGHGVSRAAGIAGGYTGGAFERGSGLGNPSTGLYGRLTVLAEVLQPVRAIALNLVDPRAVGQLITDRGTRQDLEKRAVVAEVLRLVQIDIREPCRLS